MIGLESKSVADQFAVIVADLSPERRHCEVQGPDGTQCQQPAAWWWNFHGCTRGFACNDCIGAWRRSTALVFASALPQPCRHCGRLFVSAADAYTLVAL